MTRAWLRSLSGSYGVAVGTVAVSWLLTEASLPLLEQMPFGWFFAAVMVSGWYGGLGPGVLATALTTLASVSVFSASFGVSGEEFTRLAMFIMVALLMSLLNGARKRVAETLRESEARFRLMADHAPVLIWMAETTGQYTFFNHPWLAFRGRTREQEQGAGWQEGLHPEDQQRSGEVARTAWQLRQPFQREYRLHRADGVYRWVFESAVPRYLAEGAFAGYLGSCVDITERKQAEGMRLRLAAIVESSTDAIISKSLDGVVTSWNAAAERMFGYQAAEMIGQPLLRLLPEERYTEEEQMLARLRQGERVDPFETVRRTKAGQLLDVSVTISPLRDEHGTIIGASKTARDITTHKRLEAAVQQERHLLEVTLASIGDAVIATDATGIITFLNPEAARLTGWPAQEARGRPLLEVFRIIHEQTRQPAANPVDKVMREGVTVGLANHTALLTRDGREVPIADSGAPIRDQDGHLYGAVLVFRDITEQRYIEAAMVSAKEAAETADRLKSEFLATISHELRTPLNIILGYTDMLLEGGVGEVPSPQLDILRRIDRNSRVLFELISMVLDLNRLEAGRLPVDVQAVQVPAFLAEITAELHGLCEQAGLACRCCVAPGLPIVHTDAGKLKVILRNLLSNAVKFTTEGSLTLAATERQGGIEFRVTDTGIGIPAEAHAAIFEPFRQLDGSTTRRYSGSGLGLHIVQRLLEVLGGRITVESAVGQGSTFRVWLPPRTPPVPPRAAA